MAYKRPRKDFEADLQKQESPYVSYGTPLPPLDDNVRDDGSFVPVWQQEVRDERGRKRLHGAFTGGWSAGYFNTVGSKEGWTPSTFVSSRANRAKDQKRVQQKAEDYMDDEDLAEAEESAQLQASGAFSGLGSTEEDSNRRAGLLDIFRPAGVSTGVRLLQKMGWRQGQGIGPKIRRAAREDVGGDPAGEKSDTHMFAPDNAQMISFRKKHDHKGLGSGGETSLPRREQQEARAPEDDEDDEDSAFLIKPNSKTAAKPKMKGGFGKGVLNDTGSDDEDPYTMGPNIKYNRVIGGDKKTPKKIARAPAGSANPLLRQRPVFTSKKTQGNATGFRKCHDGRLPLDGFVLAVHPAPPQKTYPPPTIPEGWRSRFAGTQSGGEAVASATFQSTAEAAKSSKLDPKSRAALLGEEQLPGKSVFDFLSKEARERLATASGRTNLPLAGNEPAPAAYRKTESEKATDLRDMLPDLDQETAAQALTHRSMPYADDELKRTRYRSFLSHKAGSITALPQRATDDSGKEVSTDEYIKEMHEFAHAARIFRPVSGLMATRFTSSSSTVLAPDDTDPAKLLSKPTERPRDPAEEAAALGMYGPMTRLVADFYPTRLVCKRFNVKPPAHVHVDPGAPDGSSTATTTAEPVSKAELDRIMQDAASSRFAPSGGRSFVSGGMEGGDLKKPDAHSEATAASTTLLPQPAAVDVERNEALEQQRPGEELFKAIFGSDDEDE